MAAKRKQIDPANLKMLLHLLSIPGKSGEEAEIVGFITDQLRHAGVPASAIHMDNANQRSEYGGQVGNLSVKLPGTKGRTREPRRLLMAHVDTVPLCVGCKPIVKGSRVVSKDPTTALGADDRSGVAVVLMTALNLLNNRLPHPPLTLFFLVQEEVGLRGSTYADYKPLGKPSLAFNFDGGSSAKLTIGATGAYRLQINITGIASHAGVRPEEGVSAITIAGLAIAKLERGGWLGLINKRIGKGTSNIGYIEAGGATNVVTNQATLRAEVRSHDPKFRKRILKEFIDAFSAAAKQMRNVGKACGKVKIDYHLDYESFKLKESEACIREARAAVLAVDDEPVLSVANGGLDANNMSANGIPTVTFGAGQENPHTVDEALNLYEFGQARKIAMQLAQGSE